MRIIPDIASESKKRCHCGLPVLNCAGQHQRSSSGDALFMLDESDSCHHEQGGPSGASDTESVIDLCYEWEVCLAILCPWIMLLPHFHRWCALREGHGLPLPAFASIKSHLQRHKNVSILERLHKAYAQACLRSSLLLPPLATSSLSLLPQHSSHMGWPPPKRQMCSSKTPSALSVHTLEALSFALHTLLCH